MSNVRNLPILRSAGQVDDTPKIHAIFRRGGVYETACGFSGKDHYVGQYLSISLNDAIEGKGEHPFCQDCLLAVKYDQQ